MNNFNIIFILKAIFFVINIVYETYYCTSHTVLYNILFNKFPEVIKLLTYKCDLL